MVINLSVSVCASPMHMLTLLSVEEILLPMYMNWYTNFRGLSFLYNNINNCFYLYIGSGFWQMDSGYNTDTDQLPVTEIYAERYNNIPDGIGKINLGPLKCWGNSKSTFFYQLI